MDARVAEDIWGLLLWVSAQPECLGGAVKQSSTGTRHVISVLNTRSCYPDLPQVIIKPDKPAIQWTAPTNTPAPVEPDA